MCLSVPLTMVWVFFLSFIDEDVSFCCKSICGILKAALVVVDGILH